MHAGGANPTGGCEVPDLALSDTLLLKVTVPTGGTVYVDDCNGGDFMDASQLSAAVKNGEVYTYLFATMYVQWITPNTLYPLFPDLLRMSSH